MICKYCGTELPDNARFCEECGNSLVDEVEQSSLVNEMNASEATAQKPVRPKKRFALYGIIGGSVVVAGAIAALVIANQAGFSRFFMGERRYAKSVLMDTFSVVEDNAGVIGSAFSSKGTDLAEALDDFNDDEKLLAALALANSAAGVDGFSLSAGLDLNPSEDMYVQLGEAAEKIKLDEADIRSAAELINNTTVVLSEKTGKDAYEFSLELDCGKDTMADMQVYYKDNGDVYISFPDASKGALMAELTDIPELPAMDEDESAELDYTELIELLNNLEEIFDEYYEDADVKVEDGTLQIENATFEGLCAEIEFDGEDMHDMIEDMTYVLSDCDYLCDLLEDNIDGFDYEKDLISKILKLIKGMDEGDIKIAFRGYVTRTNKLAGVELIMYDDDAEISVSCMNTPKFLAANFTADSSADNDTFVTFIANKTDKTSGTAALSIETSGNRELVLDFEYSGMKTKKVFGQEMLTGTFSMILNDSIIKLAGQDNNRTIEVGDKIYSYNDIVDGMVMTLAITPEGKGLRYSASVGCEELGYLGAYVAMKPVSGKLASGKFSTEDVVDVEDIADDEGVELVETLAEYHAEKLLANSVIAEILEAAGMDDEDDLIEAFTGGYDIDEYLARISSPSNANAFEYFSF